LADAGENWQGEFCEPPVVIRPAVHAQGRNVHLSKDYVEVETITEQYGEGNYYISEFIDKVAEYRVFVVSGRVACVASKTPADPTAIAWNVAQGGRFDNVRWGEWPLAACNVAIEAFNMSGLDFGGVDVMVDKNGRAYVLEINSAPSLTSPYRQECMAKCFDYIVENGKEHIPLIDDEEWKDFVHPAVSDKARV
jgi:glutathione synthase/RimK-type ligase-like ATP-grasp enzyme